MPRLEPQLGAAGPARTAAPPPDPPGSASPSRRRWSGWIAALLALLLTPPAAVLVLRWLPPPISAFMLQSEVQPVEYRWVPAARIPDSLRRAVVAAEDQKFWTHQGFDLEAIERAFAHNQKSRRKRGASTISQQVAKNLFLWPGRSYLRKALEASFTVLIEALWPKQRILEVYLNIAEFGPGVYGAEAAAQKFFGKPAAALTPPESARLAAVLPNPRKYRLASPGPYVQARAVWILAQIGYRPSTLFYPNEKPLEPPPEQPEMELPPEEQREKPELQTSPDDAEPEAAPLEYEPYVGPYEGAAPAMPGPEPEAGPEAEPPPEAEEEY